MDRLYELRRNSTRGLISINQRRHELERARVTRNGRALVHLEETEQIFVLQMRNLEANERHQFAERMQAYPQQRPANEGQEQANPRRVRANSGHEQDNPEPDAANAEQEPDAAEPEQVNEQEQVADDKEGNEEANNEESHERRRQVLPTNNQIFRKLLRDIVNLQVPDEKQKLRFKVVSKMALNRYTRYQIFEKCDRERKRMKWRKIMQYWKKKAKTTECGTTKKTERTCEDDKKCDVEVRDRSSDEENSSAITGAKKTDKQIDNEREEQAKAAEKQAQVKDVDEGEIDDVKKPEESNNSEEEDNDVKDENEKDVVDERQNDGADQQEQINSGERIDRINNAGEEAQELSVRQEQINNVEEQNMIVVAAGPQQANDVEEIVVNQVQDNTQQAIISSVLNMPEIVERILGFFNFSDLLSVSETNT